MAEMTPSGGGFSQLDQEVQAFDRLLPELLRDHPGQYVAILEGQVLDTDADYEVLVTRFYKKYGKVVACIRKVEGPGEDLVVATPFPAR
ncbi:MAG: hypothetical protein HYY85_12130 [Deltaproteobacteria bacterium]|nr:hypothetical protein [Deltaproteobacteria bacterium]